MVEREGLAVLRHCFTMLPYEDCSMIFKDTLGAIDEILSSQFGWMRGGVLGERKKRRAQGSRGDHLDADQRIRQGQMELLLPAACPSVRQRAVQGAHRGARGEGHRGAVRGQVRLLRSGGVLPLDGIPRGAAARARRVPGPARRRSRGGGERLVLQLRHPEAARGGQGPPPRARDGAGEADRGAAGGGAEARVREAGDGDHQ
uniref:Uncharacterized protein n=1 Tax=Setaria viridis TaxID=4556 RepID=A0A4U6TA36_SETVI|nr:hypothetical protein SEVIR_9G512401v2 [Setaria viridis]